MARLVSLIAVVTGGARGLGAAYAQALAEEGAHVVIADIADGTSVTTAINRSGSIGSASSHIADVSKECAVKNFVDDVLTMHGKIDILVNNAAVFATLPIKNVDEIEVSLWDEVMAVNLRGAFLMVKHVAPLMKAQCSGKIVNIGSGIAYKGMPKMLHYATSKGAIQAFTRSLSRELGEFEICVNTLAPGFILSDSIAENKYHVEFVRERVLASRALRRDGYPEDLIGALIFLASSDSDFMTGQTLVVDGGSVNS